MEDIGMMNYSLFLRLWDATLNYYEQLALRMLSEDDEVTAVFSPYELVTHIHTIDAMQHASKLKDVVAVVGKTVEDLVEVYLFDEERVEYWCEVGLDGDELRTLAYLLIVDEQYMSRYRFCSLCQNVFFSPDPHEECCDKCKLLVYRAHCDADGGKGGV